MILLPVQHVKELNDAAVVMQINFTELKSKINASEKK